MKRTFSAKTVICFVAAVGMLFAMAGCSFGKKPEFDIQNYIEFTFTGYDGEGVLTYKVDYEGLMDDLYDSKVKFDDDDVEDSIKVEPKKTTGLSNGEKIDVELDVRSRLEDNVKATFIYEDFEVKVEGLEERQVFDPFAYVKVVFAGIAPNGTAKIEAEGNSPIQGITYTITSDNRGKNLKNGDVVTIKANKKNLEKACLDAGYILSGDTKEFTVEGLEEYATSLGQITDKMIDELKKQGEDTFNSSIKSWAKDSKLDSCEYVGAYFLSLKEGAKKSYSGHYNYVYMIYHIHCTTTAGEFDYYFYVAFNDIVVKADGSNECYNIMDVKYPTGSEYSKTAIKKGSGSKARYVIGYEDVETLYNNVIRSESQYYNCENNVKAPQQGQNATTETAATSETSASDTTQATETT